jgi:hypothetical protein
LFLLTEPRRKGLKNANVKTTMFIFIIELGFPITAIIVGYKAQSTPFPWIVKLNTWLALSITFWISCSYDLSPLNRSLNCNSLEATQAEMLGSRFDFDSI